MHRGGWRIPGVGRKLDLRIAMLSRRALGKLTLGALSIPAMAAKKIDSVVHGIQFGLQSYIFTRIGLPQESLVDTVIASMVECGLGECDFFAPLVAPGLAPDQYRPIRKKFDDAGIEVYRSEERRVGKEFRSQG